MTHDTSWILIDAETTGFTKSVFAVEIAAQMMKGWEPIGPPCRHLLNHGSTIPQDGDLVFMATKRNHRKERLRQ